MTLLGPSIAKALQGLDADVHVSRPTSRDGTVSCGGGSEPTEMDNQGGMAGNPV